MSRLPNGLLAITDRSQARRPLPEIVGAALTAGFGAVMLREKDLEGGELYSLAESLHSLCRSAGRPLLVNDRLDVAMALVGVGAHVGIRGMPVDQARRLLGPDRLLGYSAHGIREAEEALTAGADYILLGPIFPTQSKPDSPPRGLGFLEDAVRELPAGRVVALGGIDASNLAQVRDTRVQGAAVMGSLMRSTDPASECEQLVSAWETLTASP